MRDRNNQEDFNQNRSQRRKKTTGVIALGLAGVLVLGSLFAYFSDRLKGSEGFAQAGTIDLEPIDKVSETKGYKIMLWTDGVRGKDALGIDKEGVVEKDKKVTDAELTEYTQYAELTGGMVLNPGDKLVVIGDVENEGSKSAWLYAETTLALTPKEIEIDDILGTLPQPSKEECLALFTYYPIVDDEGTLGTGVQAAEFHKQLLGVINGKAENEDQSNAIEDVTIIGKTIFNKYMYVLEFNSDAGNNAQGLEVTINVTWGALQYRNNNTEIVDVNDDSIWGTYEINSVI